MHDLAILNGTVISDGSRRVADVAIEGDRVAAVGVPGSLGAARRSIDAEGQYVLPGAVDIHFHCRAPSHPERGTFASETRAAAAGGVTTVFEMPISDPACSTPEVLASRRALGLRQGHVNFALYAGGGLEEASRAEALAAEGAIGFKIFTTRPPSDRLSEFQGLTAETEDAIYRALEAIRPTGLRTVFHAENQPLVDLFAGRSTSDVPPRPPVIESVQIAVVGAIAHDLSVPVHIAHVTSAAGLEAVRAAKSIGTPLTAETCPQYLLFTDAEVERWGAFAKIAPPLRTATDNAALWKGLTDGSITVLASDHSPFRPQEKQESSYADAPNGMPSVEILLPVLLDAALRGVLPFEEAVDLVTSAPARLFGLYPRKGTISPGADADIAIFAPDTSHELRMEEMVSQAAGCAKVYDGMKLRGRLLTTIVNGQVAYDCGVLSDESHGRFVRAKRAVPSLAIGG